MSVLAAGRSVLTLTVFALVVGGVAEAASVSTQVEVANVGPVVEDHRMGSSLDAGQGVLIWVWVSDANGAGDVSSVEVVAEDGSRAVASAPAWSSGSVARFELSLPGIESASGGTLIAEDSSGAENRAAVDGMAPSQEEGHRVASEELAVPAFPVPVAVALALAVAVAWRRWR